MTEQGQYLGDRTYDLPQGWKRLDDPTRDRALERAMEALGVEDGGSVPATVRERVRAYYEPESDYAGSLFTSVEPNDDWSLGAADLWAVTTLSMKVPPRTGRRLLTPGPLNDNITRQLLRLPPTRPITELNPKTLDAMWNLYDCFRTVMSTDERSSNWWVFGSKLAARKRPELFPVRDSLVCRYLTDWKPMGSKAGQLGWFSRDIQAFGYLMSSPTLRAALADLRGQLHDTPVTAYVDASDLRLLDVVLWTAAKRDAPPEMVLEDEETSQDQTAPTP